MHDDHDAPPDNVNPILDKQISDQQADIEQKRQDLSAERLAIIKSRQQSWESGGINDISRNRETNASNARKEVEERVKRVFPRSGF